MFADKAILIVISTAIGTATAETGVGAVLGYLLAAYQAVELLSLVNKSPTPPGRSSWPRWAAVWTPSARAITSRTSKYRRLPTRNQGHSP